MELEASKVNPPLSALIVVSASKEKINLVWGDTNCLTVNGVKFYSESAITRYLARAVKSRQWFGNNPVEESEVNHWITYSQNLMTDGKLKKALEYLDGIVVPVTYLVGNQLSLGDIVVWSKLQSSAAWAELTKTEDVPTNVARWFKTIANLDFVASTLNNLPSDVQVISQNSEREGRKEEGKFVDLPGAEMGKVVVRFPPEASGYLHIGHAKAALLNQYYQQSFKGKLIFRFDDTNPAKEKEDFEKVILEDVEMLEVKYDHFSHTSDHFELMLQLCEKLIKEGKAYVDDTDPEQMKAEREQKLESKNRNNPVEKNLKLWNEMKGGTDIGQKCCVRAKIDMSSPNGCLRDPTIYRCKNEIHPRTGSKYKAYPTYDFACPIVDSIEGVTHCLRTMEYHDRDDQFYWFIDALGLRKPHIWEYSRLNMTNTVLSKRKLTWFVENGYVDGWDDPRMPTVRGVLRRGMTIEGLRQFIIAQGSSKSVVFMEWDKIWAINKKIIDPVAPRYTAVEAEANVLVEVSGVQETVLTVPKHPKNDEVGTKLVSLSSQILVDKADADLFKEGENVTFINWGNVTIKEIIKEHGSVVRVKAVPNLEDKNFKKTMKITWLAKTPKALTVPCICVYFDHIISKPILGKDEDFKKFINHNTKVEVKMIGDPELAHVKKSEIIQLQRKGFFICDRPYEKASMHTGLETPIVLFSVPDGHTKVMPTTIPQAISKAAQPETNSTLDNNDAGAISRKITEQGNKIRDLKNSKSPKNIIDAEVKLLLSLKADYKERTGVEWQQNASESHPKPSVQSSPEGEALSQKVAAQANKVRELKTAKAAKGIIDAEVKALLALKADFKQRTGKDWVAGGSSLPATSAEKPKTDDSVDSLSQKITAQGVKVRELKSSKAAKDIIDVEVKTLLDLKVEFKSKTGRDWAPNMDNKTKPSAPSEAVQPPPSNVETEFSAKIAAQGDKVRNLKNSKAAKNIIDEEVKVLLALKAEYKHLTGKDWGLPLTNKSDSDSKKVAEKKQIKKDKESKKQPKEKVENEAKENNEGGPKKVTRLGLEASKATNLPEWYSQVLIKGELIEYYDVSGCYILRPWSYNIWETIKDWLDQQFKSTGVKNCYFPIFVSRAALEKEKTHIADFSPEVAWVTKSGDSDLAEPIAIRPTSETVMYPAYAKWIRTYRDLPMKLNQWNNVVRWEFKHPQPFLRTREFLWQEGHTAFANLPEAEEEVLTILGFYEQVYTDLLAIPVVKGRKTEKEKFAGGDYTTTVEAFISASGRAIQGATSHHLGQNFSKMFEIVYEDPETQEKKFVYQNSWGLTTRSIGVMIMVHADDQGLVLPPRVAPLQIIIVPCGITVKLPESEKGKLLGMCQNLTVLLTEAGMRAEADLRDNYSPGWKFNHWELKGVPLRIEIGPKDMASQQVVAARRDDGTKTTIEMKGITNALRALLDTIQKSMLQRATEELLQHMVFCADWKSFCENLEKKNIIQSPFCGRIECEDKIKEESARSDAPTDVQAPAMGAKGLCIPFSPLRPLSSDDKCIHPACTEKPQFITLFGRSY